MALNFSTDGTVGTTRPPRVINVSDVSGGCPTNPRTNPLMTMTFTVAAKSVVIIQGEIIRRRDATVRCDLGLYGPGYPNSTSTTANGVQLLDQTADYNDARDMEWDNACFRWMGYVDAGTVTFYVNSLTTGCINLWGCTSPWGQMNAIIFE